MSNQNPSFTDSELSRISQAIYSEKDEVIMQNGEKCEITRAGNGCRQLWYKGIRFMAQNPHKGSIFAKAYKNGARIVWGMTSGSWIYIRDHQHRDNPWQDAREYTGQKELRTLV